MVTSFDSAFWSERPYTIFILVLLPYYYGIIVVGAQGIKSRPFPLLSGVRQGCPLSQGLVHMAYLHRVFLRTVSLFCKLPCTLNLSMDPRSLGHLQPFVRCTGILSMHTPIIVIMKRPSGKSHTSHGKKTRLQKEKIRPTSARH